MTERTSPLKAVADRHGVTPATMKRWIRQAGFCLPKRLGKGRYTIQVPASVEERVIEKRVPRVPRQS